MPRPEVLEALRRLMLEQGTEGPEFNQLVRMGVVGTPEGAAPAIEPTVPEGIPERQPFLEAPLEVMQGAFALGPNVIQTMNTGGVGLDEFTANYDPTLTYGDLYREHEFRPIPLPWLDVPDLGPSGSGGRSGEPRTELGPEALGFLTELAEPGPGEFRQVAPLLVGVLPFGRSVVRLGRELGEDVVENFARFTSNVEGRPRTGDRLVDAYEAMFTNREGYRITQLPGATAYHNAGRYTIVRSPRAENAIMSLRPESGDVFIQHLPETIRDQADRNNVAYWAMSQGRPGDETAFLLDMADSNRTTIIAEPGAFMPAEGVRMPNIGAPHQEFGRVAPQTSPRVWRELANQGFIIEGPNRARPIQPDVVDNPDWRVLPPTARAIRPPLPIGAEARRDEVVRRMLISMDNLASYGRAIDTADFPVGEIEDLFIDHQALLGEAMETMARDVGRMTRSWNPEDPAWAVSLVEDYLPGVTRDEANRISEMLTVVATNTGLSMEDIFMADELLESAIMPSTERRVIDQFLQSRPDIPENLVDEVARALEDSLGGQRVSDRLRELGIPDAYFADLRAGAQYEIERGGFPEFDDIDIAADINEGLEARLLAEAESLPDEYDAWRQGPSWDAERRWLAEVQSRADSGLARYLGHPFTESVAPPEGLGSFLEYLSWRGNDEDRMGQILDQITDLKTGGASIRTPLYMGEGNSQRSITALRDSVMDLWEDAVGRYGRDIADPDTETMLSQMLMRDFGMELELAGMGARELTRYAAANLDNIDTADVRRIAARLAVVDALDKFSKQHGIDLGGRAQ